MNGQKALGHGILCLVGLVLDGADVMLLCYRVGTAPGRVAV